MFVNTFIRRPILATVCSLVIVLGGVLAIPQMPIAQYPQVAPPTVSVTAMYTGANAETVETAVTTPLEQAINGVEGMLYMTSSSTNSGASQIVVTFDTTRDPTSPPSTCRTASTRPLRACLLKSARWVSRCRSPPPTL
jgi:HAE1 family hydrophobic/amphiphilic exporter-1